MPLQPLYFQPGINKNTSVYSAGKTFAFGEGRIATGRYTDCDKARFVAGFPEKIGGWVQQNTPGVTPGNCGGTMIGVPAGSKDWLAFGTTSYLAIGTDIGNLYIWDGTNLNEITPRRPRLINTLSSPFTTTNGSTTVAVADNTQNLANGDWVYLTTVTAVGGLTISGWFSVGSRTASGYSITSPIAATSTAGPGGGTVTYYYPRIQLTNPIATTIGSKTVTITDNGYGAFSTTDSVRFDTSVTVGGVTLFGSYVITLIPNNFNAYTIQASTAATSTVASGGGTLTVTYAQPSAWSLRAITTLVNNPFSTTSGSGLVTVTDFGHGMGGGAGITFHNATTVAGLTINGTYGATITDVDHYTINVTGTASSTTTGGGSTVVAVKYQANLTKTPTWSLDNFGSILVANYSGTGIYVWDASFGVTSNMAYSMLNAPNAALATFITPERFVVALGINPSGSSPTTMNMAWSDQANYTVWTPAIGNAANSGRVLQFGNYMVAGTAVGDGVSLIFTDTAVYAMNYTGDVNVYSTPVAAINAGLIGQLAFCVTGGIVYWVGTNNEFWHFSGSVAPLPSDDIRDFVFNSLNNAYGYKCVIGAVNAKKEVIIHYPSGVNTNNNLYMIYHIDQNCWANGSMGRTTWRDAGSTFANPLATGTDGLIYKHETGVDANSAAMDSFITTSQIDITNGAKSVDIFGFLPDFQRLLGSGNLFVNTRYYPEDGDTIDGPFVLSLDNPGRQDLRSDGREVGFKWESNVIGGDWRIALCRVDIQPAGSRR